MYINNNHKNKKVITLVGNSSIKLLLVLQKFKYKTTFSPPKRLNQ